MTFLAAAAPIVAGVSGIGGAIAGFAGATGLAAGLGGLSSAASIAGDILSSGNKIASGLNSAEQIKNALEAPKLIKRIVDQQLQSVDEETEVLRQAAEYNINLMKRDADLVWEAAKKSVGDEQRDVIRRVKDIRAQYAKAGINFSGTAINVALEEAEESLRSQNTIISNAQIIRQSHLNRSEQERKQLELKLKGVDTRKELIRSQGALDVVKAEQGVYAATQNARGAGQSIGEGIGGLVSGISKAGSAIKGLLS